MARTKQTLRMSSTASTPSFSTASQRRVSIEESIELAGKVSRLTEDQISGLIPIAPGKIVGSDFEIDFNNMSDDVFRKIEAYVIGCSEEVVVVATPPRHPRAKRSLNFEFKPNLGEELREYLELLREALKALNNTVSEPNRREMKKLTIRRHWHAVVDACRDILSPDDERQEMLHYCLPSTGHEEDPEKHHDAHRFVYTLACNQLETLEEQVSVWANAEMHERLLIAQRYMPDYHSLAVRIVREDEAAALPHLLSEMPMFNKDFSRQEAVDFMHKFITPYLTSNRDKEKVRNAFAKLTFEGEQTLAQKEAEHESFKARGAALFYEAMAMRYSDGIICSILDSHFSREQQMRPGTPYDDLTLERMSALIPMAEHKFRQFIHEMDNYMDVSGSEE